MQKHRKAFVVTHKRRCATINEVDEAANGDDASTNAADADDEADETRTTSPVSTVTTAAPARHIHPCVCDLTFSARKRVTDFRSKRRDFLSRYDHRVHEIEELAKKMEQMRLDAEREAKEHKELYEDEYEMIGTKRKRKKRSARRASMVSLGVRTLIKWKKEPLIPVKYTRAWNLRRDNSAYCGEKKYPLPLIVDMNIKKEPLIPVRDTQAYILRSNLNVVRRHQAEIDAHDPHPYFITAFQDVFD